VGGIASGLIETVPQAPGSTAIAATAIAVLSLVWRSGFKGQLRGRVQRTPIRVTGPAAPGQCRQRSTGSLPGVHTFKLAWPANPFR